MDRNGSEDGSADEDEYDTNRAGIYRPPRVAAMPYTEGPAKGKPLLLSFPRFCTFPNLRMFIL